MDNGTGFILYWSNSTAYQKKNKSLSDSFDEILAMQGIGWIMRKAISIATVTLTVNQYTDEKGYVHIDIMQTATGGIRANPENRIMDWEPRFNKDNLFGEVTGRSRWVVLTDIEPEFGREDLDWLNEGWDDNGEKMQGYAINEKIGWTANTVSFSRQ
jgi:hypothetical protein